jgi:hypothetical protein
LFEPGIALTTSKDAVREIAGHFALVETIVRELTLHARASAIEADDALLRGPGVEPDPLSRLAAEHAGALTTADVWKMAGASIDDSAKDGDAPIPRPEGTRIALAQGPGVLSITYGLRFGFWVTLAVSVSGALLVVSALRAEQAPDWAAAASARARALPPIPWLDAFAADAPTPWLIVGAILAVACGFAWTGYVRRVTVDVDRISIYRGFRPFPRVYRRPLYGRAIRLNTALYIAKADGFHMLNPTASPILTEPEAKWLASEMKRVFRQA